MNTMQSFHLQVTGFTRSYWHFYVGFGLVISVYLLAQAVLLWQLASLAKANPVGTRPVIAVFFATAVLTTVLAWMFFFLPPLVINAVIAVFLGLALASRL